ncbi:MAG: hypothetical protein NTZ10_01135 [Candidatus Saganbacteria bacterium]|nr:hypothetical protein [Candidatus Saganbacteria bacterium]
MIKPIISSFLLCAAFVFIISFYGCGVYPPAIGIIVSPAPPIIVGTTVSLSCEASTTSGNVLTYLWSASGGTLSSTAGSLVQWTAPLTAGTYTINVSVSDGSQSSSATSNISVIVNVPSITVLTATPASVGLGLTSILSCEATSPNGKPLTFIWTADKGTLSSNSGNIVSWKAPTTAGTSTIGVTVNDTLATVSGTLKIDATSNPLINSLTATSYSITAGQSVVLTCDATSSLLGGTVTINWAVNAGSISPSIGPNVTWTTLPTLAAGTYTITVTVTDNATLKTNTATTSINVLAATGPIIQNISPALSSHVALNTTYPLQCNVTNENGGHNLFTYSWTSNAGGTFSSDTGYSTNWTSPASMTNPTSVTITVTITDPVTGISKSTTTNSTYP